MGREKERVEDETVKNRKRKVEQDGKEKGIKNGNLRIGRKGRV